jgi:hypothetical protein
MDDRSARALYGDLMQIKLSPIRDNKTTEYHVLDDSRLVIDGTVYDIAQGAAWPNAREESIDRRDPNNPREMICSIEPGPVVTILCRHGKDGAPSDCGPFEAIPDGYDAKGLSVVAITAQTADEIAKAKSEVEKAAKKVAIESDLKALDAESLRPLRAVAAGTATAEDIAKIKDIDTTARAKRAELAGLAEIKGGKAK